MNSITNENECVCAAFKENKGLKKIISALLESPCENCEKIGKEIERLEKRIEKYEKLDQIFETIKNFSIETLNEIPVELKELIQYIKEIKKM